MKKALLLPTFFLILSCHYTQQVSKDFTTLLNTRKKQNSKLEKKVFQNNNDTNYRNINKNTSHIDTISLPYLTYPIFFLEGNIIFYYTNTTYKEEDLISRIQEEPKYFYSDNGWGVFEVKNDTIIAKIFNYFWGKGSYGNTNYKYECNYMGFLKNKETILGWKMVPPYPEVDIKFQDNITLLEGLKRPRNMYLKEVPLLKYIDPNKAWINKLKSQEKQ